MSSDGKYLFYGTDVGGLYRSTDNGKTWDKSMKNFTASGAPTQAQIGSNYCERRIRCVAVDPNNQDIIYAGGGSYTYQGDSSLYRSCDGRKTWKVVSINGTNSIVSTKNGDYGGVEPTCINVKPDTGELWASGNCTGLSKLTPPYAINQNNSNQENNGNTGDNDNSKNNVENENKENVEIQGDNKNNSNANNTGNDNGNQNEENKNIKDVLSNMLPFAGKKQFIIYVIIISCIISGYFYIKYKKAGSTK